MSPVPIVLAAALVLSFVLSIICFAMYAVDKSAARKGTQRIPERTLLSVGYLGGWPGALVAQHTFRHKTRKQPFRSRFAVTIVASVATLVVLLVLAAVAGPDVWRQLDSLLGGGLLYDRV